MKEVFKQLILEFNEFEIPNIIARKVDMPQFPEQVRKAVVFIGMRCSGKTWLLYQNIQKLLAENVSRNRILYINFEDERLLGITASNLQGLLDAFFELFPESINSPQLYFHLYEIKIVEGWEKFVRRLLDTRQISLFLSGSSAKLLSKEIATELRGRSLSREVFPLSFEEYLQYHSIQLDVHHISSKQKAVVLHHLGHYLRLGGFPETLGTTDWLHREILQSYVQIVIYRDFVERHRISSISVLERWVAHCMKNAARSLSIHKVYLYFKSLGLQVSKNSLYEWLDYMEDAYCIFPVSCFDQSERKASLKPKKIYPVDPGLVTAFTINAEATFSANLETAIFGALRRKSDKIYYYQTKQGWEVDFLIHTSLGENYLVQAAFSLKESETRKREVRALAHAMQELGEKKATIVTFEEEEEISIPEGIIQVTPAWKYFYTLELSKS